MVGLQATVRGCGWRRSRAVCRCYPKLWIWQEIGAEPGPAPHYSAGPPDASSARERKEMLSTEERSGRGGCQRKRGGHFRVCPPRLLINATEIGESSAEQGFDGTTACGCIPPRNKSVALQAPPDIVRASAQKTATELEAKFPHRAARDPVQGFFAAAARTAAGILERLDQDRAGEPLQRPVRGSQSLG